MGMFARNSEEAELEPQPGDKAIGTSAVADLLRRNNIDPAEIGRVQRVSVWQGMSKDENGEPQVTDLIGVQLSPAWEDGPEWPVVQPAAPTVVKYGNRPKPLDDEYHRTVLFPDPQIGYWRNLDNGDLHPIHDEEAMAVALNVARAVRPDRIVHLGDFLDLAEFGRFGTEPELAFTTQESLNRGHRFLAECRAILGPDGDLALIAGNHDHRLSKAVTKNALAALRLKRADAPDTWPVMSVPYLLALDSLNCEYVDGYPAGSYKLADGTDVQTPLYAVHERGLDVVKVAKQNRQSYVQGHTHRVAMHSETYELNGAPIEVEAWSLGSLCSREGAVPSYKSGVSDKGSVVRRIENWQHAVAVVTVAPDGSWSVEPIRIRDGKAHYGGKVYTAE